MFGVSFVRDDECVLICDRKWKEWLFECFEDYKKAHPGDTHQGFMQTLHKDAADVPKYLFIFSSDLVYSIVLVQFLFKCGLTFKTVLLSIVR